MKNPIGWSCNIHRLHLCREVRLSQRMSCDPFGWGCRIHRLHLCREVRLSQRMSCDQFGWGCRIHRLHLCREVRLPQRMSCGPFGWGSSIHRQHLCREVRPFLTSALDMTSNHPMVRIQLWSFGECRVALQAIAQDPHWPWRVEKLIASYLRVEYNFDILNVASKWIELNRTVWSFDYGQTKDWCLIKFFVLRNNTWIHLTEC